MDELQAALPDLGGDLRHLADHCVEAVFREQLLIQIDLVLRSARTHARQLDLPCVGQSPVRSLSRAVAFDLANSEYINQAAVSEARERLADSVRRLV